MLDDDDLIVGTKTVVRPFWRRLFLGTVIGTIIAIIGGFILFTGKISTGLPAQAALDKADGIVVLTGGQARIEQSFALLLAGKGQRLLITGVDPAINKEKLRDLAGGGTDETAKARFDCCVDIEHEANDTEGNAKAAQKWAAQNGFDNLIMVTSAYHVPRAMLIFEANMPTVKLASYPVPSEAIPVHEWYLHANTTLFLLGEYAKTLWTWTKIQSQDLIGG